MNNKEGKQTKITRREAVKMLIPATIGAPLFFGSLIATRQINSPEEIESRNREIEAKLAECPEGLVCEPEPSGNWKDAATLIGAVTGWGLIVSSGILIHDSIQQAFPSQKSTEKNKPQLVSDEQASTVQSTSIEELKATFPFDTAITVEASPVKFKHVDETGKSSWHHGVDLVARAGDEIIGWHREAVTPCDPNWKPNTDVARRRDEIQNLLTAEESLLPFRDMEGVETRVAGLDEEGIQALHQEASARHITAHWRSNASE